MSSQRGMQQMGKPKGRNIIVILIFLAAIFTVIFYYKDIKVGLDLQGGMHIVLRADTSKLQGTRKLQAVDQVIEILQNRIDQFGVSSPIIQKSGKDRIIVELPGIKNVKSALALIGQRAVLEFKLVDEKNDVNDALNGRVPPGREILYKTEKDGTKTPFLVFRKAILTGAYLKNARVEFNTSRFNEPYVSIDFNSKGARIFSRVTGSHINERLAIVLDGKIQSAPVIRDRISGGRAQITGNFTLKEAQRLAIILRAGSLPVPINVIEKEVVGPSLGRDSIRKGLNAIIIGGLLVFIFMIFYYSISGVISDLALIFNLLLIVAGLIMFKATLTLPGIAGMILTVGMAVDANVLIFERIREELKQGKTPHAAIDTGYKKAFITIIDANVTTLITALVLYQFGTGAVRGFAVTLSMGIIASVFTAVVFTHMIFDGMHGVSIKI